MELGASVHWQCFKGKKPVIETQDSHYCTWLGHLRQQDTNRIISIYHLWPRQVRKVISCHDIMGIIALNSATVNTSFYVTHLSWLFSYLHVLNLDHYMSMV